MRLIQNNTKISNANWSGWFHPTVIKLELHYAVEVFPLFFEQYTQGSEADIIQISPWELIWTPTIAPWRPTWTEPQRRLWVSRSAAHLEQLQAVYFHLAGPIEVATHRPLLSHLYLGVKLITQMQLQFSPLWSPLILCRSWFVAWFWRSRFKGLKQPEAAVTERGQRETCRKQNLKLFTGFNSRCRFGQEWKKKTKKKLGSFIFCHRSLASTQIWGRKAPCARRAFSLKRRSVSEIRVSYQSRGPSEAAGL